MKKKKKEYEQFLKLKKLSNLCWECSFQKVCWKISEFKEREREGGEVKRKENRRFHEKGKIMRLFLLILLTFFLSKSFKIFQKWEKYYKIVNWESCPIWLGIVPRKWFFPKSLFFFVCVWKKKRIRKREQNKKEEKVKTKKKKKKWNNVFNKVSSPISLGISTIIKLSLRDLKSKKLERGKRKEGRKREKVRSWKNEGSVYERKKENEKETSVVIEKLHQSQMGGY